MIAAAVTLTAVAAPALDHDSMAKLATGGLIFVHNDNLEMRSENRPGAW
jgi:hypothetical protein